MSEPAIVITVLAHNEERRLARCLESLPLGKPGIDVHVVVNGSTDDTIAIARDHAQRFDRVFAYNWEQGGKARSWNRFVFDTISRYAPVHVFVDGDAQVAPGSIDALATALYRDAYVNAASAPPLNGRRAEHYRQSMVQEGGLFGDLYALSGQFLQRMKDAGIRLPEDLIGDDGLVAALARTDLGDERQWDIGRIAVVQDAGFYCEPVSLFSAASWTMQFKRMTNYSVRHFQNRIITRIMRGAGPAALPARLADLYPQSQDLLIPRKGPVGFFDRRALARMNAAEPSRQGHGAK